MRRLHAPQMLYAAKCYWPQVTQQEVEVAAVKAAREATRISRAGPRVTYVGAVLFPADELLLCLFESASSAAVKQTNERVGIRCERVMESVWLARPDSERTSP
jgi:hypothetical protein